MFHSLSLEEVVATVRAADALAGVTWAGPLLTRTADAIGNLRVRLDDRAAGRAVAEDERGLFFELRFAEALHLAGATADYEVNCGVGESTVDFRVRSSPPWLVELVSLRASDAVQAATTTDGTFSSLVLTTPAPGAPLAEKIQSEEGEIIKAQERIGEKAYRGNRPVKFPAPTSDIQMIMVDARGFLGVGGDRGDWVQIANGPENVQPEFVRRWTNPATGQSEAIAGLYEARCPGRASPTVRERIHVIGFVCEKTFEPDEIARATFYCFNPHLADDAVRSAWKVWPLRPAD